MRSQVLCGDGVLDSSEYWLQNEKALCRLGLLEGEVEAGCTVVSSSVCVCVCAGGPGKTAR